MICAVGEAALTIWGVVSVLLMVNWGCFGKGNSEEEEGPRTLKNTTPQIIHP